MKNKLYENMLWDKKTRKPFNFSKIKIRNWVNAYKTLGINGLKECRKGKCYSLEFKLYVVKLYLKREIFYQTLINRFNRSLSARLDKQIRKYKEEHLSALTEKKQIVSTINSERNNASEILIKKECTTEETDRIKELEEQVLALQIENVFIKRENDVK